MRSTLNDPSALFSHTGKSGDFCTQLSGNQHVRHSATGWNWARWVGATSEPAIFTVDGIHPICIRTPKMARLEAILLVSEQAQSARKLTQLATLADVGEVRQLVQSLNDAYQKAGSPFRIEQIASGYRLLTLPVFSFWLGKLHQRQAELKLTPAALETLAVIAYRQPVTRADVEVVRGVQSTEMLKQLMDRKLVRIAGEEDTLGRPFLYETTRRFLEIYGFKSLAELPSASFLRRAKPQHASKTDAVDDDQAAENAA